jgi:hypothetical protein
MPHIYVIMSRLLDSCGRQVFVCIIVLSAIAMEPFMPHIYVCIIVLSGIVLVLTLLHYYLYYSYYAYHSHSSYYL